MSYVHSRYEVEMVRSQAGSASLGGQGGPTMAQAFGVDLLPTTYNAAWGPGYVPHIIRGAAVILSASNVAAFGNDAVEIKFDADISTPGTPSNLFSIELPSAVTDHSNKAIYYTPTYYIEIKPGMTVKANTASAATAGVRARLMLYVEPRWEEPANVTAMKQTT